MNDTYRQYNLSVAFGDRMPQRPKTTSSTVNG